MASSINSTSAGNGGLVSTGDDSGILNIQTNETTAITVDASQNVGIGTSSPTNRLTVNGGSGSTPTIRLNGGTAADDNALISSKYNLVLGCNADGNIGSRAITFVNSTTEYARIDSSGNLLVGTTSSSLSSGVGFKFTSSSTVPNVGQVVNTSGSTNTYHYYNDNATNGGYRFYVNVNGGIYNFSGNNSNLSDERTKTNITLADNYLDKICAIPVKTFNYKDEPSGEQKTLGLIAQDVQRIAPEFVNSDGKWEVPEGESPLLSIYSTDMMFALMKSIQELKAMVDSIQSEFDAYKATHP
jgi:hypothetical protein